MIRFRSPRKGANGTGPATRGPLSALARLWKDREGATYIFVGVALLPLLAFVGVSADASRAYLVQARLSTSVDAAALAAGKKAWLDTYDADARKYFNSNFPPEFLGATVENLDVSKVDASHGGDVVKVSASVRVPTAFMHLFGHKFLTVSADAEVTRKNTALDVVLAMDMSGSMDSWSGGKKKIDSAREAATTLVNILYGDQTTSDLIKIGLVPWNANVNVMLDTGKNNPLSQWKPNRTRKERVTSFRNPVDGQWQNHVWKFNNSPVRLLFKPDTDWKGCVFARYTDDGNSANDADDDLGYVDDQGWKGWEPRTHGGNTCWQCSPCLPHGIFTLSQDKSKTLNAVDKLRHPQGNTVIPAGLSWAWRVLMNTEPFTEGSEDDPERPLVRAIVLLTDGANCAARGDAYKQVWGGCWSHSTKKLDERAIAIAQKIKAQGIYIYTIQFGFNDSQAADVLKAIASGQGAPYYHYAPDSDALQKVFAEIGNALTELRISK